LDGWPARCGKLGVGFHFLADVAGRALLRIPDRTLILSASFFLLQARTSLSVNEIRRGMQRTFADVSGPAEGEHQAFGIDAGRRTGSYH